MGKRYYCDYCDKSFADNASNRRNHLTGVYHQKNKKDHYDSFIERDPANILAEASRLPLCNTFRTTGECRFGHNCRWSHVTDEVRADLERQIRAKREASEKLRKKDEVVPTLEEWLEKRQNKKLKTDSGNEEKSGRATDNPAEFKLPVYTVPPVLANYPTLPPTLLPPPPDSFQYLPLEEWG